MPDSHLVYHWYIYCSSSTLLSSTGDHGCRDRRLEMNKMYYCSYATCKSYLNEITDLQTHSAKKSNIFRKIYIQKNAPMILWAAPSPWFSWSGCSRWCLCRRSVWSEGGLSPPQFLEEVQALFWPLMRCCPMTGFPRKPLQHLQRWVENVGCVFCVFSWSPQWSPSSSPHSDGDCCPCTMWPACCPHSL